jgi:branched-chain amino acid transport system ATP-binding protein
MSMLLETRSMTMQFGGLKAVDSLSFHINSNELIGLIGPNGAGKTTVFNMITGVYEPTSGDVLFAGQSVKGMKPYEISHLGMTRTFQNIRLFKDLTVLENVMIAGSRQVHYSAWSALLHRPSFFESEEILRKKGMELLSIFGLGAKANDLSSSLPYGEQRKLEIVRALATNPKLICLDEPAAGLNHQETHSLMETIAKIRKDFNLAVLLIEHDMKLVMGICERIIVLDHGVKIEEGVPSVIQNSAKVIEAYLGPEGII